MGQYDLVFWELYFRLHYFVETTKGCVLYKIEIAELQCGIHLGVKTYKIKGERPFSLSM
jgi:hypothetical protein